MATTMPQQLRVHRKLSQVAWRLRWVRVARFSMRGLCVGLAVCLASVAGARLRWWAEPSTLWVAGAIGFSTLAGALGGLLIRISQHQAARRADEALGLNDRLATAVELMSGQADGLAGRQVEDAAFQSDLLKPRTAFPVRMKREMIAVAVMGVALAGVWLAPKLPMFKSKEAKLEAAALAKTGEELERKLAKLATKNTSNQAPDEAKKAQQEAKKLAEAMKKQQVNKKTALTKLTKLTKQAQEQQQKAAQQSTGAKKTLAQAAAEMKKSMEQKSAAAEAARKNGEKAGAKPGEKSGNKQGDKAKQQNANQGNKPNSQNAKKPDQPGGQPPESQAMQMAQAAMQQMQQATANSDFNKQAEALKELAKQMQAGQMSAAEMAKLQKQMEAMAKALKGTDLDKVAKQLEEIAKKMQAMNLDPKKLAELAKKLGECAGQCQGGGKPGAGQMASMTAADLDALLQALKDAKLQLGNGGNIPAGLGGMPNSSMRMGLGGGKGGRGAGMQATKMVGEDKKFKLAKLPPNTKITGKRGTPNPGGLTLPMEGDPRNGMRAGTPLYQVNADQRRANEGAVNREKVPAEYQKQVKDYFTRIGQ